MPPRDLFPPIEPYASGMLRVDDLHTLYWEESGNPKGVPVVFLHGGPGAGASPTHRRFFDPSFWRIIIFDQRGAGRSIPRGEIRNNTTQALIEDIETLRTFRGVEKWHVFGGSWGSTLALAYGQTHPDRCLSFALRGICLWRKGEIDWYMTGIKNIFPDYWQRFASLIPPEKQDNLLQAYYDLLTGPEGPEKTEATRRWLNYETLCASLVQPADTDPPLRPNEPRAAMPLIEAHYFLHNHFTPDTKLLDDVHKIRHIPAVIVQGRYDIVCPIISADALHRAWPEAAYHIIPDAGHSLLEVGIRKTLVEAMEKQKELTRG